MQQTTTYKLNLIETDDVFSPEPLNQNARKVETALADGAAALAEETAARQKAVADEIAARQKAVSDEAAARKDAVAAETAAREKAVADEAAARKSAVTALERHKFACGTYVGSGTNQTIQLPFTPKAVVIPIVRTSGPATAICLAEKPVDSIKITTGGFTVSNVGSSAAHSYEYANTAGATYAYLAFA